MFTNSNVTLSLSKGALLVTLFALAGCGGAATSAPPVNSVNPTSPSYSSLQFAVGTANMYGNGAIGLNVVSTFRQTGGESATGVNTPSLTGNFKIQASPAPANTSFPDPYTTVYWGGPSIREARGNAIAGTSQSILPGTPACDEPGAPAGFTSCPAGLAPNTSTFGQSGGVFAMGLAPYNAVASSGQAYSYQPYPQPFYAPADNTSQYAFVPWGGPPAFDPDGTGLGERDGVGSINGVDSFGFAYFLGVGEGITVFDGVTPGAGNYTLNVAVATVGNGGAITTNTLTKGASLNPAIVLPAISTPAFTPDGNGGGSFTATLPAGVTEAYVQIVDYGPGGYGSGSAPTNCQGPRGTQFAPVYYTIHLTASGTYKLPDTIGPNTATSGGKTNIVPSPSICTAAQNTAAQGTATAGDDMVVQMIGFDYPIYAAALGLTQPTTPQNPSIVGSNGQADITIAQAVEQTNGGTVTNGPLIVRPRPHATFVRRIPH